jgi:magnesium-transporting ATPase (P-type)
VEELKIRSPFGVWGLTLISFGIYGLFWYAKTATQIKAVNPDNPKNVSGSSLVVWMLFGAITLFIVPIINWFKLCASIKAEQQAAGLTPTFNTGVATLLCFLAGTNLCYIQAQQNLVVTAVQARQSVPV